MDQMWGHWVWHPVARCPSEFKRRATEISPAMQREYLDSLRPGDQFAFVEELAEPLSVRISLGCGAKVWDGWQCLDRCTDWAPGVRKWEWPEPVPYATCRADAVFVGHLLEYLRDEEYEDFFLEVWRVLRPCAVLRITDQDGYQWRPLGCARTKGTGRVQSRPTWRRVRQALLRVGFQPYLSRPGETISPCRDVLCGDGRLRHWRRGHTFYADAVKAQQSGRVNRLRFHDPRMTRQGRYFHVFMPYVVKHFLEHSRIVGRHRVPDGYDPPY